MNKNDVAIVGISIFCPGAENVHDFWDNISKGVDSIIEAPNHIIDHEYFSKPDGSIDKFYCNKGGFSKPITIDPLRYGILPITAEGMDPEQLVMLGGVEQALFDAGIFHKNISLKKGCVILGKGNFAGLIALRSAEIIRNAHFLAGLVRNILPNIPEEEVQKIKKEYQAMQGRYQADTAIGTMPNLVASMVANKFDIQGPAYTVDAACASGLLAVDHAINLLNKGQCDIAIAGGIHTGQSPMFWSAFNMMGAMSKKGVIAPFSEEADGLLIGHGGGMVILKKLQKAIDDNDRIYAVIKGTGVSSDGGGSHVMVTSVQGQIRALEMAWKQAKMNPRDIGYVEAHGTGTPVGDKTEISTLTKFFGDKNFPRAYVGSVKSNIGHTMPAAGMIGLIKTALSLYHKKIPPTLHCEQPMKAMFESRFLPPQELIDWDENKYPLIAGVNAFGFGGINSHAILSAHNNTSNEAFSTQSTISEPAIIITAKTKEELIKKLETKNITLSEGDYRLVIFNPNDEKIELAKTIIQKGETWIEKQDIWFSSNPVIKRGGKIVFVFPGFDMNVGYETDSLSENFNIPKVDYNKIDSTYKERKDLNERTRLQESQGTKIFYNSWINDYVLKEAGITPDMYTGFSIGEWYATISAGMVTEDSVERMMSALKINREKEIEDIYFISVACDYERIKLLSEHIRNLYLAIDCSINNVLMCGNNQARIELENILKKENISCFIMPFKSGFHTPFLDDCVDTLYELYEHIKIEENHIPVWSASSLAQFPTDKRKFIQLIADNVNKPLYFKTLIQKLYEEQEARIFIQVGPGGTVDFINNILENKEYYSISSALLKRKGLEQIRRVLALLFIQGKQLDYKFLKVLGVKDERQILRNSYTLPQGAPMTKEFPALQRAVEKYYSSGALSVPSLPTEITHPALQSMNDNINEINHTFQEILSVQEEMVTLFDKTGYLNQDFSSIKTETKYQPTVSVQKTQPQNFEEKLNLKLEDHPYLLDHSIIRQPENWKYQEDLNPVIPMTMTLELFAEIAHRHAPGKKILKIGPATIMKWMSVEKPFEQTIVGKWKNENTVVMEIKEYANIEITFGDEYPAPPPEYQGNIDIGKEIMPPITKKEVYDKYTFHGPAYQSTTEIKKIAERGVLSTCKKEDGKGSLLDSFGQCLGLFLHLTETDNLISFPVKLKELCFYQDMYDQQGIFEQTTIVKSLSSNFEIGDIVLKREGKIWGIAKNWISQRFPFNVDIWNVILKPGQYQISKSLAPNICYYDHSYSGKGMWMFLSARYLNFPEKQIFEELLPQQKDQFLASRIAIKDAVNSYIRKENENYRFPVEIFIKNEPEEKPTVYGFDELKGIQISLVEEDKDIIAIASDKPVGIAIKSIKQADAYTHTPKELNLIRGKNKAEWSTRLCVAKEAYRKMMETHSKENPQLFEVSQIEEHTLYINGIPIKTVEYKKGYIAGWTDYQ